MDKTYERKKIKKLQKEIDRLKKIVEEDFDHIGNDVRGYKFGMNSNVVRSKEDVIKIANKVEERVKNFEYDYKDIAKADICSACKGRMDPKYFKLMSAKNDYFTYCAIRKVTRWLLGVNKAITLRSRSLIS